MNECSPDEIQEVADFLLVGDMLSSFVEQHLSVFKEFRRLAEEYNQKLQAADKAVRSREVSCGPFIRIGQQVKYDWEALFTYCNGDREAFMEYGGKIQQVTKYSGDREHLGIRIEAGDFPEDDVANFRTVSPRFKNLSPISVPWSI